MTYILQFAHHFRRLLLPSLVYPRRKLPKSLLNNPSVIRWQIIHGSKCLIVLFRSLKICPAALLGPCLSPSREGFASYPFNIALLFINLSQSFCSSFSASSSSPEISTTASSWGSAVSFPFDWSVSCCADGGITRSKQSRHAVAESTAAFQSSNFR